MGYGRATMRRPDTLQVAVAAMVATAVALAALIHTHVHVTAHQRGAGTACVYCENPPVSNAGAVVVGSPVLTRLGPSFPPLAQPDRIVVLEHSARDPPRT